MNVFHAPVGLRMNVFQAPVSLSTNVFHAPVGMRMNVSRPSNAALMAGSWFLRKPVSPKMARNALNMASLCGKSVRLKCGSPPSSL